MLVNPPSVKQMNSPTGSVGSVRLRRRDSRTDSRVNRHSGDIGNWSPRILSPRLFRDSGGAERRTSGDWSYVSFPSSPGTPKSGPPLLPRTLEEEYQQTERKDGGRSLLESKVIASILLKEEATAIKSASGSPHRFPCERRINPQVLQTPPPTRCRSAMETLDRKLNTGSVGVRRKLLGAASRLEDVSPCSSPNYRPVPSSKNAVSKVKRRSQSSHRQQDASSGSNNRFSEVLESTSMGGGIGRRSATQWELSRRVTSHSENEDISTPSSKPRSRKQKQEVFRWKSQEHVDQLFSPDSCGEDDDDDQIGIVDPLRRRRGHEDSPFERRGISELCEEEEEVGIDVEDRKIEEEDDEAFNAHSTLKKGILWQQRDKIFSRWKERFFILTKDYLQCFKKESHSRLSEMGGFIFKLKLSEVELVELVDKKGYLTVCLSLPKDGKVLLRKNEGIRDWFTLLKSSVLECRSRGCMKTSEEFWSKKNFQDSPNGSPSNFDRWLLARQRIGQQCTSYIMSNGGAVSASEDFMSLPVAVSSPIDAEYYHRKSRQLKDITSPLTSHRTPSKSRRSTSRNNHLNYVDSGSPSDSPRDNQRKSLFVSDNNFDSGNDSMNTNTSTGGSTDSSNKEVRSRSKSRGPAIPENDYESLKYTKDKFRERSTTDGHRMLQRRDLESSNNSKSNYRRSQFVGTPQSTRV